MKPLAKSFSPAQSQRRERTVRSIDEPGDLLSWLRERYIPRKISDASGAPSTETVDSSDSEARTARSYSIDHEEGDSVFRAP